jgi:hypothetical protein
LLLLPDLLLPDRSNLHSRSDERLLFLPVGAPDHEHQAEANHADKNLLHADPSHPVSQAHLTRLGTAHAHRPNLLPRFAERLLLLSDFYALDRPEELLLLPDLLPDRSNLHSRSAERL